MLDLFCRELAASLIFALSLAPCQGDAGSRTPKIPSQTTSFVSLVSNDSSGRLALFDAVAAPQSAASTDTRVGTNLGDLRPGAGTGVVFVDAMKQAAPWTSSAALKLDRNGSVTGLAKGQSAETVIYPAEHYAAGNYTLLYDGTGSFAVDAAQVVSRTAGRIVVRIAAQAGGIHLRLTATDPHDYARNVRLILPGFEATYTRQPFHPLFLRTLAPFHVVRFAHWMHADTLVDAAVPVRTSLGESQAGPLGVAPEYMIALANATGADPWFTFPMGVTNTYVTQFAKLVHERLDPRRHPIFEYGQDAWKAGSATNAYAIVAGINVKFSDDQQTAALGWYSTRSVQLFGLVQQAFGAAAGRVVRVLSGPLASTLANETLDRSILSYDGAAQHADAFAVAGDDDLDATALPLLQKLTPEGAMQTLDASVASSGAFSVALGRTVALLRSARLPLIAYEGGVSLQTAYPGGADPALANLFVATSRSPGIRQVNRDALEAWHNLGGGLLVTQSLVTAPSNLGASALLEQLDQAPSGAYKLLGVTDYMRRHPTVHGSANPAGVAVALGLPPSAAPVATAQARNAPSRRAAGARSLANSAASAQKTVTAFSLYDTVGVDTHLQRSIYSSRYSQMNALLSYLGASHIRDSFRSSMDPSFTGELATLHQQFGIDFTLTTSIGENAALWAQYAAAMRGSLVAIEGVNEPNNGVSNWDPQPTRQLQKAIWDATHGGQPSLTGIKSINASVLNCSGNAAYGDQSATTDYATMHKYWPGINPNTTGYGGSTCGSTGNYGSLDYNVHSVQQSSHHPIYATETGYCTANIHSCVPQAIAAAYEPEIALTMFLYGGGGVFARQFIYEISSEDTSSKGGSLGLTDPNFAPKPMYYAVAGMLKRLKDKRGAATVPISYSISGSTANLKTIPLSYSDGTFGMVLFQDTLLWDQNGGATAQGSPINVPTDNLALTINGQTVRNVIASTYGANGQWTDTPKPGGQAIPLSVGTYMTILRWSNGGTPAPIRTATPTPTGSPTRSPSPSPTVGATATPAATATPISTASPNPSASPRSSIIAIDAGGHAAGNWLEDRDYAGGTQATYYRQAIDTSGVANPAPQAVYQTGRYADTFSYRIPGLTPGAAYTVRLHFSENHFTKAGQRVFSVSMSGSTQTLSDFDIVARAGGAHKATAVDFAAVTADSLGTITISFSSVVDTALISGIEVD